jgi:repressor LexA
LEDSRHGRGPRDRFVRRAAVARDRSVMGGKEKQVGALIRERREALRLSLSRLAEVVECGKSYLSEVETEKRPPPGDAMLEKLEMALMLPRGRLVEAAGWQRSLAAGGAGVREEVARLEADQKTARRLAELLRGGWLDEAYRSGELKVLVDRLSPESRGASSAKERDSIPVALAREVPLINRVAAGYPTEFTDLGYPARVADEYVRCPDLEDPDAFAARVVGDSMRPQYAEGDIVIFSPAKVVKSGMDCFARLEPDHETTFKRVYFEERDGEELIRLQPLNAAYPPRVVGREMVAGLYAAVSVMRRVE